MNAFVRSTFCCSVALEVISFDANFANVKRIFGKEPKNPCSAKGVSAADHRSPRNCITAWSFQWPSKCSERINFHNSINGNCQTNFGGFFFAPFRFPKWNSSEKFGRILSNDRIYYFSLRRRRCVPVVVEHNRNHNEMVTHFDGCVVRSTHERTHTHTNRPTTTKNRPNVVPASRVRLFSLMRKLYSFRHRRVEARHLDMSSEMIVCAMT